MEGLNETYPCSYHLPMDGAQIEKPEKEVKKQEELQRVKSRAESIDFKTIAIATSSE